jgi:hypothetical protein
VNREYLQEEHGGDREFWKAAVECPVAEVKHQ